MDVALAKMRKEVDILMDEMKEEIQKFEQTRFMAEYKSKLMTAVGGIWGEGLVECRDDGTKRLIPIRSIRKLLQAYRRNLKMKYYGDPPELSKEEQENLEKFFGPGNNSPDIEFELRQVWDVDLYVKSYGAGPMKQFDDHNPQYKSTLQRMKLVVFGTLEYASKELKNDREVVLAAVRQNRDSLQFASLRLRCYYCFCC